MSALKLTLDPATRRLSLDPRDPAFVQDPAAAYRLMHAAGSRLFWADFGFWCFAGFRDVEALLRDRRFGREPAPDACRTDRAHLAWFDRIEHWSLLALEPPDHTRLRRFVNRAFVSARIGGMAEGIRRHADALVDAFEHEPVVDLLPALATPIPLRAIATLMGVPESLEPRLLQWSHAMVKLYTLRATRAEEDAADAACADFHAAIADLIALKQRRPAGDLLSSLASSGLSLDEIVSTAVLLMNAGHEATVHQVGNAVLTLLAHTADPAAVVLADVNTVVEEAMRLEPPLHLFTRHANEDVDLGDGLRIARGERIGLLLAAANRDPAVFAAPDRFDTARKPLGHVSFGGGIHFCLGAPLARLEMAIALDVLFRRLPRLSLSERPAFADSWHFHGLERLPVRPRG
jgi:cytochrome P450